MDNRRMRKMVAAETSKNNESEEVSSIEWEYINMTDEEEDLIYRMHRLVGDRFVFLFVGIFVSFDDSINVRADGQMNSFFLHSRARACVCVCVCLCVCVRRWGLIAGRIPGRKAEEIERFWIMKHGDMFAEKRRQKSLKKNKNKNKKK